MTKESIEVIQVEVAKLSPEEGDLIFILMDKEQLETFREGIGFASKWLTKRFPKVTLVIGFKGTEFIIIKDPIRKLLAISSSAVIEP